jgi:hypothetical protein
VDLRAAYRSPGAADRVWASRYRQSAIQNRTDCRRIGYKCLDPVQRWSATRPPVLTTTAAQATRTGSRISRYGGRRVLNCFGGRGNSLTRRRGSYGGAYVGGQIRA